MPKQTVLITGGAGFIGKYTVRELLNNNFDVIVVDKKRKPTDFNCCKYFCIDVASPELVEIFKENKIDYVIHLAALPSVADSIKMPLVDCHDNYQATVNICTIAKHYNVKKIIFSSTAAVYANPQYLPVDEKHPTSFLSPYAITKNASEHFVQYCGLDYIILRYANVYGSGQDASGEAGVVAKFFERMALNLPVEIHGNGFQYRDFINVKDIAKVNVISIKSPVKGEIINVSTNIKTSINELFNVLKKEIGYSLNPKYTVSREGDIEKSVLSNDKLISLFDFVPSVSLAAGIKEMVKDHQFLLL